MRGQRQRALLSFDTRIEGERERKGGEKSGRVERGVRPREREGWREEEVLIAERGSSAREFCPQVGSPDKASKALEAAASVGSAGEGDECKSTARDSA